MEDCPAYWVGNRDRGNRDTCNLMLGLRGIQSVQGVDSKRSKSPLRNGQRVQESIQEGFLVEVTLLLGLKDE